LATGADYNKEMSKLLSKVNGIDMQIEENVDAQWFVKGTQFSPSLTYLIQSHISNSAKYQKYTRR